MSLLSSFAISASQNLSVIGGIPSTVPGLTGCSWKRLIPASVCCSAAWTTSTEDPSPCGVQSCCLSVEAGNEAAAQVHRPPVCCRFVHLLRYYPGGCHSFNCGNETAVYQHTPLLIWEPVVKGFCKKIRVSFKFLEQLMELQPTTLQSNTIERDTILSFYSVANNSKRF